MQKVHLLNDKRQGEREIAHIDMDSFFVSVERVYNPGLIGKPVVVGGDLGGRGVVASASYEARSRGVRSAMPVGQALRMCPDAIVVHGNGELYARAAYALFNILCDYSPAVEMASIDEAYIDLSGRRAFLNSPEIVCERIIKRIGQELKLPCSMGLAPNKLLAKISSDMAKPHGLVRIFPGYESVFMAPLPLGKVPGVGKKTLEKLNARGLKRVGDVAKLGERHLERIFGRNGTYLYYKSLGLDESPVALYEGRKSMSREVTFEEDTYDRGYLGGVIVHLCEKIGKALRDEGFQARTVTLKLRYSDFRTITRAKTLRYPTNFDSELIAAAKAILDSAYNRRVRIRLLGVHVGNFVGEAHQLDIFRQREMMRLLGLYSSVDKIKDKYGFNILRRARCGAV